MTRVAERFGPALLRRRLEKLPRASAYCVGFSGGADSSALLHALAALRDTSSDLRVRAIHIHHGLHPDASRWAAHCQRTAAEWGVDCERVDIEVKRGAGHSVEEAARMARYAAIERHLRPGEVLLTAHHADDQAETLLLNLLKGAGAAGLAAMPDARPLGRSWLLRPLLGLPRAALLDYLSRSGIAWLDDPANLDLRFDRNYLRHEILPRLVSRWPAVAANLGRAARNQGDLASIAEVQADADLALALDRGGAVRGEVLVQLQPARRANLLRRWLKEGWPSVTASREQIERITEVILPASRNAAPSLELGDVLLSGYRGRLYKLPNVPPAAVAAPIIWHQDGPLEIPGMGWVLEVPTLARMLPDLQPDELISIRFAAPGSVRFKPFGARHSNTLKHWYQTWGVPPWKRASIPLVYRGENLVAVAGYGISADVSASLSG